MASIIVTWDKMGSEFTYEVSYSKHPVGPWIRHHDFRLTDDVIDIIRGGLAPSGSAPYQVYGSNVYTIDGLDDGTKYYVNVACADKYHRWWYSYSGIGSLGGGQANPAAQPSPSDGNTKGFQMLISTGGFPFGFGKFGGDPGYFGGS
jgi:hypothetical protein